VLLTESRKDLGPEGLVSLKPRLQWNLDSGVQSSCEPCLVSEVPSVTGGVASARAEALPVLSPWKSPMLPSLCTARIACFGSCFLRGGYADPLPGNPKESGQAEIQNVSRTVCEQEFPK